DADHLGADAGVAQALAVLARADDELAAAVGAAAADFGAFGFRRAGLAGGLSGAQGRGADAAAGRHLVRTFGEAAALDQRVFQARARAGLELVLGGLAAHDLDAFVDAGRAVGRAGLPRALDGG